MFEENILNIYTDYVKFTWVGFLSLFFLRVTNCKANVKIKEKKKFLLFSVYVLIFVVFAYGSLLIDFNLVEFFILRLTNMERRRRRGGEGKDNEN